jgi:hypothetical protein
MRLFFYPKEFATELLAVKKPHKIIIVQTLSELQHEIKNIVLYSSPSQHYSRRILIYRHNVLIKLTKILENIYFVISLLTGHEFFKVAAEKYIQLHPPLSGRDNQFGLYFSGFLKKYSPADALEYLPDMAKLSWAHYEVAFEKECGHNNLAQLQNVPEKKYPSIRFILHPAIRVVSSIYPLLDIWQLCQKKLNPQELFTLDLSHSTLSGQLLVFRQNREVVFEKLTAGEFALLSAFHKNLNFKQASKLALKADPSFNSEIHLKKHVMNNIITGFSL